jgi:hypothetical protein
MSAIRTDRPRNGAFNKERARVEYANRRLSELREQGVADAAAWETIATELRSGAADDCGCYRASAMCKSKNDPQCRAKESL